MHSYPPIRRSRVILVLFFLSIVVVSLGLASRDSHSQELTAPSKPYLVRDVNDLSLESDPSHLTDWNGVLYFSATDGVHGAELWKSDGTNAGTVMVRDLVPGAGGSFPSGFQLFKDKLYFVTSSYPDTGERLRGLWMTDGSEQGTELIFDLGSGISWMKGATSNRLFFFYDDGVHGRELWALDGMGSPPYMVKDIRLDAQKINASSATEIDQPRSILLDDFLYFFTDDGIHGNELWRTDGTEAGTRLVVDATPGPDSSYPTSENPGFMVSDGSIYFHASSTPKSYWKVNGDSAQEIVVFQDDSGNVIGQLITVHQGKVYLSVVEDDMDFRNGLGKLWMRDGADGSVVKLLDAYHRFNNDSSIATAVAHGDILFLRNISTDSDFENVELWRTDGTPSGTGMVADIMPGEEGSVPIDLIAYRGQLYFFAYDDVHGTEFWRTDGTDSGTKLVKDLNEGLPPSFNVHDVREYGPTLSGEALFFKACDEEANSELWRSDGTAEGTWRVAEINTSTDNANPQDLTAVGDRLFFTAEFRRYNKNRTLWYTDGTESGTDQVVEFRPYAGDNVNYELVAAAERLFVIVSGYVDPTPSFPYNDTTRFVELWVVDVADALLLASWEGLNEYWSLYAPAILNDRFYGILTHEDASGSHERQIWTSDGTIEGTSKGPNMPCVDYKKPNYSLRSWGGSLYCVGLGPELSNGAQTHQLWKSDGSDESITPIPGVPVDMLSGVELNGYLYFGGYEPMTPSDNQNIELWRSDGTAEGSTLVKEINPLTSADYGSGSNPRALTVVDQQIFFLVDDATSTIWVTDGTTDGTKSIAPDANLIAGALGDGIGDELFFGGGTKYETVGGYGADIELWKSDGTESGTLLVADLAPGLEKSSNPQTFAPIGNLLYFVTDTHQVNGHDRSLMVTTGTADGTQKVMMIEEDDSIFTDTPGNTIVVGDKLYLTAHTRQSGVELWAISHAPAASTPTPTTTATSTSTPTPTAISTPTAMPTATRQIAGFDQSTFLPIISN